MRSNLSAVIISFLCAAGCSTPPAALPSFRGAFTERAALSLLFKDIENPSWDEGDKRLVFEKDKVEHYAAAVVQFPLQQQGSERLLLVFETNEADNDCHACRGTIGAAIFSHEGETWRIATSQRDVTPGPPYGASADGAVSLIKIGPDRYALRVSSSDLHFGVSHAGVSLLEVKPGFPDVFTLLLSGNNEGNCTADTDAAPTDADAALRALVSEEPCYDFSGDLAVVPGTNAEYHDLAVAFRGTHVLEGDKNLVPFNEAQRYMYRSGKYVPVTNTH